MVWCDNLEQPKLALGVVQDSWDVLSGGSRHFVGYVVRDYWFACIVILCHNNVIMRSYYAVMLL